MPAPHPPRCASRQQSLRTGVNIHAAHTPDDGVRANRAGAAAVQFAVQRWRRFILARHGRRARVGEARVDVLAHRRHKRIGKPWATESKRTHGHSHKPPHARRTLVKKDQTEVERRTERTVARAAGRAHHAPLEIPALGVVWALQRHKGHQATHLSPFPNFSKGLRRGALVPETARRHRHPHTLALHR